MKKPLIVIAGPTASGKTSLSVELAKRIDGEIISADSMQVYKYMDIGTAKITPDEMKGVPHHLIDVLMPDEAFSIHKFQTMAKEAINQIYSKGKIPIIVGGTGFYIQSVTKDIEFEETNDEVESTNKAHDEPFDMTLEGNSYRKELEDLANIHGKNYVHELLKEIDPISYESIHPNNLKRVIRALEYYKQTGKPISQHNEEERKKESPYDLLFYVLNMDRSLLYERINQRVDQMIDAGLVEEVKKLKQMGYTSELVSMQGLGYKEMLAYLDNEYDLDRAIYLIKRDTRHFAKRQLTWFRREKDVEWILLEDFDFQIEKIINKMVKDIEEKQNM